MRYCIRFSICMLFLMIQSLVFAGIEENMKITTFYFRFDNAQIDLLYRNNQRAFEQIQSLLADSAINRGLPIRIIAYASPEGNVSYNYQLAQKRLNSLNEFLSRKLPQFKDFRVTLINGKLNWSGLRSELIESDYSNSLNQKTLDVLIGKGSDEEIERSLQEQLTNREYKNLIRNYFPSLRVGEVSIPLMGGSGIKEATLDLVNYADSLLFLPSYTGEPYRLSFPSFQIRKPVRPFALKTNLLFDLATALNVELEVPLAKRWSIAGEWMFPWWLWKSRQRCLEVLSGTLEAKFWFPNDKEQTYNKLTGWYTGLYAGGGLYDLEWDKVGYQGEFYIAAGVSAGYAHAISRYFSMEYSIGIGYLSTDYRKYEAEIGEDGKWHLYRTKRGNYSYFGPTKLKVSLVWRPVFYKKCKKGGEK